MTLKDLQEEGNTKLYQWIKEKDKDWEKKTLDEVYQLIRQQAIKETIAMVLKEIDKVHIFELGSGARVSPCEKEVNKVLDSLKQKLLQVNPREEI